MNDKILKPTYYFLYHFIRSFLFLSIFPPIPVFGISGLIIFFKHNFPAHSVWMAIVAFVIFLFVGALLIALVIRELYKNACFKILKDRVEYRRDFFALQIKDLKYKNVKEMTLTQGPLQKMFGIGTILLQSHASPQTSKAGTSGLRLYNIKDPEAIYTLLKKEVDRVEG